MKPQYKTAAGALMLIGAAQLLVCIAIAEAVHPGYSAYENAISDLGVGATAWLFNCSAIVSGAMAIIAAFLILKAFKDRILATFLALLGTGLILVGLFPENTAFMHTIAAALTFFFGPLAALAAYRITVKPMKYLCLLFGIISIAALALFETGNHLGIGWGMERMIVYPPLYWAMGFGGYLIAKGE